MTNIHGKGEKGIVRRGDEKICHSSSLGRSERRSVRTVACSGNSLVAYFRTATIQGAEVLRTDATRSGRTRERGMCRGWAGFLGK